MIKYAFVIFLFVACNNERRINEKEQIRAEGKVNSNGMETGPWKYFTEHQKIIEEGYFENGIRVGKWRYHLPHNDSIFWIKYFDKNNLIKTNIPDFLLLVESNDSIVSFKNKDSSKVFNLVIGKNYSDNFYSYRSSIYDDIASRNITLIDTASQYIETDDGKKYLYNYISGSDTTATRFFLFNIAGLNTKGELVEISLRCEAKYEDKGRKIFFSIIPNLFIGSVRFLDEQENISVFDNSLTR